MPACTNNELLGYLSSCRNVLAGKDESGIKTFPGMFDDGVISFSHGEGMRRPHPMAVVAGIEAMTNARISSLENYLFLQSYGDLNERIRRKFSDAGVPPKFTDELCIDAGVTRLLQSFLWAYGEKECIFLTSPSFYHPLPLWCENLGIRLEILPTSRDNDYKISLSDLANWICSNPHAGKRLKGLVLFNPSMTGAVYTQSELEDILAFIRQHNLAVFEDAIFMGTEYDGVQSPHLLSLSDCPEAVVLATGASKQYNLANLRIGWACGDPRLIANMSSYGISVSASIPQVSKMMAAAALATPEAYYTANIAECKRRLHLLSTCIRQMNEEVAARFAGFSEAIQIEHEPHAAHSLLINLDQLRGLYTMSGQRIAGSLDITRFFLEFAGVSLAPGLSHGFRGCRNRLSFACVGLEHTYPESQVWEKHYTDRYFQSGKCELIPELETFSQSNRGWEAGRQQIREGLLGRVLPALIDLLHYNVRRNTRKNPDTEPNLSQV
jgi:aspartate aminotransferase